MTIAPVTVPTDRAAPRGDLLGAGERSWSWHHDRVRTLPRSPQLSRRAALRAAGGVVLGASVLVAATGCSDSGSSDTSAEVEALTAQAERARRDAANASAAIAAAPDRAAALTVIAAERTAHADALDAEIARAGGSMSSVTSDTAATSAVVPVPPSVDLLRTDLAESQKESASLARTQSGYRAGLLGSISAACAVQQAVLLP
ncbi:hypothetical protein [Prescottella sp. R16]|uniref:hypothetical protein n=1 Tax=Prescottella sp. R16 TaxID=3064529 RepID=UPI00272E2854|nr:hypothetical protein [Prescottella sp. R16]